MAFTRFSSTDPADLAGLLNRLGDELGTDIAARAPGSHTHAWGAITSKPTTFPPGAHGHSWGEVTGKPTTFPPAAHGHAWGEVTGKPTTFPPAAHSHAVADVTGLPARLTTLEQDTGNRSLGAMLAGYVSGDFTLRRIGKFVHVGLYNLALTPASGSAWVQTGALPTGFKPAIATYVYFPAGTASADQTPGPFRVDKYGGLTVYSALGKVVNATATWVTDDPFPTVLPGSPA